MKVLVFRVFLKVGITLQLHSVVVHDRNNTVLQFFFNAIFETDSFEHFYHSDSKFCFTRISNEKFVRFFHQKRSCKTFEIQTTGYKNYRMFSTISRISDSRVLHVSANCSDRMYCRHVVRPNRLLRAFAVIVFTLGTRNVAEEVRAAVN